MVEYVRNLPVGDQAQAAWSAGKFSGAAFAGAVPENQTAEFQADPKRSGPILHLPVPRKDAVLVVLQMLDFRSYRLWIDGSAKSIDLVFGPATELAVFGGNAASLLSGSGHWLHFYVSRNPMALPNAWAPQPAAAVPYPPSVRISDAIDHRLGECLIEAMCSAGPGDQPLLERLLKTLLECLLLSLHVHAPATQDKSSAPVPAKRGGLAPWQVRRAQQIMSERLEESVAIEELAAACRLSKSHFARAFKVATGQSPHRWHLEYRVERAKQLMIESDRSLADIALTCGFADQSHFAKSFGRFVGCPPGTWRRAQYPVVIHASQDHRMSDPRYAGNDNIPGHNPVVAYPSP